MDSTKEQHLPEDDHEAEAEQAAEEFLNHLKVQIEDRYPGLLTRAAKGELTEPDQKIIDYYCQELYPKSPGVEELFQKQEDQESATENEKDLK